MNGPSASNAADPSPAAPILEMIGITKRFPGVVANDGIDLALRPGEVHVLLGENGAGKSTLIAILSGLVQPDAGQILIGGRARTIGSPRDALHFGISTVYQSLMLAPTLSVSENLMLGSRWWSGLDRKATAARLRELSRDFGLDIDPDAIAGELSLGQQQQVEIARALLRGSRVLILDEATSMLTPAGIEELGRRMRRLVARGMAIVFISHKLNEALAFGDRITVLRLGRKAGEIPPERLRRLDDAAAMHEIVGLMFGRAAGASGLAQREGTLRHAVGPAVLDVRGLTAIAPSSPGVHEASLVVHAGEILGIAGIDGNGQRELAMALAGQLPASAGEIRLEGRSIASLDVGGRRRAGVRYLTDDRHAEGTVAAFPIATNLLLKDVGTAPFWSKGVQRSDLIQRHAETLVEAFDVRTPSVATPVGRLSGGNMQKVLLARELSGTARFVMFAKPTYGLDVQNIRATRDRIREVADSGVAVMLLSTDLEELLELSDRIAVMSGGRIVGTVDNDAYARERVGQLMVAGPQP